MNNLDDLFLALQTIPMVIGGIQSFGMFVGFGVGSNHITALHSRLQLTVDKGINDTYFRHVFNVLGKTEVFFQSKLVQRYMKIIGNVNNIVENLLKGYLVIFISNRQFMCLPSSNQFIFL